MTPKLNFKMYENPGRMISIINSFLTSSNKGFDWSSLYYKEYPKLKKLLKDANNEEITAKSKEFFENMYLYKAKELEKLSKTFQTEWDKNGNDLLKELSHVIEKTWPLNCKKMIGYISLDPVCPRFLDDKSFEVYWRSPPDRMKRTAIHEILHFLWFEKWKEVFPNYDKKEFEAPHLVWKLSEMVPQAVLGDERIQKVFPHSPGIYNEWKIKKINNKPLLECLQEIYDNRKSFEDFMKKSWSFVQKNKNKINQ